MNELTKIQYVTDSFDIQYAFSQFFILAHFHFINKSAFEVS